MEKYTLNTDFSSLNSSQANDWLMEFGTMVKDAFKNNEDRSRLLGNLLIMERYINTLRQGLAADSLKISAGLECAHNLLWDYLEERIIPTDFQDFANDFYDCLLAYNVGNIYTDVPKEFYQKYFAGTEPNAYELLAVEWSSNLLMQLVSIAGGRIDFEEFEECNQIDFYGIDIMLHILEDACNGLTNAALSSTDAAAKDFKKAMEQIHQTPLFHEIIKHIQDDLQIAHNAASTEYATLRREYQDYTIIPEKYAKELLEY